MEGAELREEGQASVRVRQKVEWWLPGTAERRGIMELSV